jgi:hypothetical protein
VQPRAPGRRTRQCERDDADGSRQSKQGKSPHVSFLSSFEAGPGLGVFDRDLAAL